jgi:hypothetical protein
MNKHPITYTMLSHKKKKVPGNPQKPNLNIESIIFSVVTSCSVVDWYQHAKRKIMPSSSGT